MKEDLQTLFAMFIVLITGIVALILIIAMYSLAFALPVVAVVLTLKMMGVIS